MQNEIKVHFELEIVEDGFPPIRIETLNAIQADGLARIDNTPFFVTGVALGDIIDYESKSETGVFWITRVLEESGNKAISIIFLEESCKESVFLWLRDKGCYCEFGNFGNLLMLAICVFKEIPYEDVRTFLDQHEMNNVLSYAELCI